MGRLVLFPTVEFAILFARPAVSVMALGINDGVPIGGVTCCGPAWSIAHAARARSVMRTYARGAQGRVLWLTLPVPRYPRFAEIARAVNLSLREAAADQDRVTLIPLDVLLTRATATATRRGARGHPLQPARCSPAARWSSRHRRTCVTRTDSRVRRR